MTREALGVAVVGFGWMGHVHSRAYLRALHHYPEVGLAPRLMMAVDPEPERQREAMDRYGFESSSSRWEDVVADERIRAVSVTTPNSLHRDVATALASAGKHLWLEKPVGLILSDVEEVASAVETAGVQTSVGFNYRNVPAVERASQLIAKGDIGTPTTGSFFMMSDYAADPEVGFSWRFRRDVGGNGVLGDMASHAVDLVRYTLGEIGSLVADSAIFIEKRPSPIGKGSQFSRASGELQQVENDDYVRSLFRSVNGAHGVLEASRVSVGDKCRYGFDIHGSGGTLSWDFRRMGELVFSTAGSTKAESVSTSLVGPGDGELGRFQPAAGIAMSYDDLKVIEAARFLQSIASGVPCGATIRDALAAGKVLDAMGRSSQTRTWTDITR